MAIRRFAQAFRALPTIECSQKLTIALPASLKSNATVKNLVNGETMGSFAILAAFGADASARPGRLGMARLRGRRVDARKYKNLPPFHYPARGAWRASATTASAAG
jgi:hypothetical protein